MDPSPSRALRKSKLPDFTPPRLVILPNLARFPENLRMTISTHRPFEAKPVQPDSLVLTSYIERIEFQLFWKSWRPILSQSFFLRCPGEQNQESHPANILARAKDQAGWPILVGCLTRSCIAWLTSPRIGLARLACTSNNRRGKPS